MCKITRLLIKMSVTLCSLYLSNSFVSAFIAEDQQIIENQRVHPEAWKTSFNKITQLACHNCYEPEYGEKYGFGDKFSDALDFVSAVELDIWDSWSFLNPFGSSMEGNWYVRHYPHGGNHSNCSGDGSLEYCLKDIASWSDRHPNHFPVTLFLDKKQSWSSEEEGRSPRNLFVLLDDVFGDRLFTPKTLFKFNQVVDQSPRVWKWPEPEKLKGKIIVVVNGGNIISDALTGRFFSRSTHNSIFNHEQMSDAFNSKAFVGPYVFDPKEFALPVNMSHSATFLNMKNSTGFWDKALSLETETLLSGRLIRIWGTDDESFCKQPVKKIHYAAYYDIVRTQCHGYRVIPHSVRLKTYP